MKTGHTLVALGLLMACAAPIQGLAADTLTLGDDARKAMALSVYNDNLVLFSDSYQVELPAGRHSLRFSAISPLIEADSALLHPLPEDSLIRQQVFQPGLTPTDLLRAAVGQVVSLVGLDPKTGERTHERARLLSLEGGLILEVDGRIETELAGRRIVYDRLPPGVLQPTLQFDLDNASPLQGRLVLSYLGGGLSWQANYVARLNPAQDHMQLQALAGLSNHSGVDLQAARVELVAGEVRQVSAYLPQARAAYAMAEAASAPVPAPVALGDLYRYSLPEAVDLPDGNSHQVGLFRAADIPVEKRYRLDFQAGIYHGLVHGKQTLKAQRYIEFDNQRGSGLGWPLPAGLVRVYLQAGDGPDGMAFIGADRIEHTAENTRVRLNTGRAFDISAERTQLDYRRLPVDQPYRHHSEVTLSTRIYNAGAEAVSVEVQESFSGEWLLIEGPEPVEQAAQTASWLVQVPAKGEHELRLTIRVKR